MKKNMYTKYSASVMVPAALILLTLSTVWLLRRLLYTFKVPTHTLVDKLQISLPPVVLLTVDSITANSISLTWDSPSTVASHILLVNAVPVGSFPRKDGEQACTLTDLKPDTNYQIELLSVNSRGYRSKHDSLYIRTQSEGFESRGSLENPSELLKVLMKDGVVKTSVPARSRSNTQTSVAPPVVEEVESYTKFTKIEDLDDLTIEDLKTILVSAQEDLHDVLEQQQRAVDEYLILEATLLEEKGNLKARINDEADNKRILRGQLNTLENSKNLAEVKRSKLENIVRGLDKNINRMRGDMEKWKEEMATFANRDASVVEKKSTDVDEQSKRTRVEIAELNQQVIEHEDVNKLLLAEKKKVETKRNEIKAALEQSSLDHLRAADHTSWEKINKMVQEDLALEQSHRHAVLQEEELGRGFNATLAKKRKEQQQMQQRASTALPIAQQPLLVQAAQRLQGTNTASGSDIYLPQQQYYTQSASQNSYQWYTPPPNKSEQVIPDEFVDRFLVPMSMSPQASYRASMDYKFYSEGTNNIWNSPGIFASPEQVASVDSFGQIDAPVPPQVVVTEPEDTSLLQKSRNLFKKSPTKPVRLDVDLELTKTSTVESSDSSKVTKFFKIREKRRSSGATASSHESEEKSLKSFGRKLSFFGKKSDLNELKEEA